MCSFFLPQGEEGWKQCKVLRHDDGKDCVRQLVSARPIQPFLLDLLCSVSRCVAQKYGANINAWNIRREGWRWEWTLPYVIGKSLRSSSWMCSCLEREEVYQDGWPEEDSSIDRRVEWKFLVYYTALVQQWKKRQRDLKSKQPMHGNSEYVTARRINDEVAWLWVPCKMREKARTIAFKNSSQDGLLDHVTISTVGQPRQQELDKRGPHKHDVLLKLHGQLQMSLYKRQWQWFMTRIVGTCDEEWDQAVNPLE